MYFNKIHLINTPYFIIVSKIIAMQARETPELSNSSIIKPRDVIHCLSLRCICQFPTHNMSCILCLPFIKIIIHADDVLNGPVL